MLFDRAQRLVFLPDLFDFGAALGDLFPRRREKFDDEIVAVDFDGSCFFPLVLFDGVKV
ncbi:MAG TPA: hypothetical protein VN047_05610 [Sphingopyxis sp.]|uniref:hypothetical protein n=1 Tax=Sphingopyxis sp. TaxID=1908224 RepID=UPI002B71F41B|nr:hypothetical protein [Sphingopyxis sp.]HWW56350.1 hypothetical protein [Sphingopyxis sp.]